MIPEVGSVCGVCSLRVGSCATAVIFAAVYLAAAAASAAALFAAAAPDEHRVWYLLATALTTSLALSCCGLLWGALRGDRSAVRVWLAVHCVTAVVAVVASGTAATVFSLLKMKMGAILLAACFGTILCYSCGLFIVCNFYVSLKVTKAVVESLLDSASTSTTVVGFSSERF